MSIIAYVENNIETYPIFVSTNIDYNILKILINIYAKIINETIVNYSGALRPLHDHDMRLFQILKINNNRIIYTCL